LRPSLSRETNGGFLAEQSTRAAPLFGPRRRDRGRREGFLRRELIGSSALGLLLQVQETEGLKAKAEAATTQVELLRDELKLSTRQRWYSNHRTRWYSDPATTLHVEWSQLAGVTARQCTDLVDARAKSAEISLERMRDAVDIAQDACGILNRGLGLSVYVALTGSPASAAPLVQA